VAITKAELQSLVERRAAEGARALSVYLDVDQSRAPNLNHGYLAVLKDMLRSSEQRLSGDERRDFTVNAERVIGSVARADMHGRTLVTFSSTPRGIFWQRAFQIRMPSCIRWEAAPYVRPLVEAADEYERYGVVVVDREKARLFTVYFGEIEEQRDVFSDEKRKLFRKTSKDTTLSQPGYQRREGEHVLRHLKEVAAGMESIASRHKFDRLILAGPHQLTSELGGILPKKLQSLVIRSIALPIDASEAEVLSETMRVEEEMERDTEERLVDRLITAASKDNQAALGLQPTLNAKRSKSILKLVYVQGLAAEGAECTNCGSLFAGTREACAFCGSPARHLEDVIGRLADMVLATGGDEDTVRGPAAERLTASGGIGAFLRY
jgi:peptide chain release factor subunit 1